MASAAETDTSPASNAAITSGVPRSVTVFARSTAMRLLKTTIGSYIFMGEGGAGPDDETVWEKAPLIWQIPMVVSPSMAQESFIVGAF